MNKKMIFWVLIGWGIAIVLPPQQVVAMLRGKRG